MEREWGPCTHSLSCSKSFWLSKVDNGKMDLVCLYCFSLNPPDHKVKDPSHPSVVFSRWGFRFLATTRIILGLSAQEKKKEVHEKAQVNQRIY
jgi:hypothetical protein